MPSLETRWGCVPTGKLLSGVVHEFQRPVRDWYDGKNPPHARLTCNLYIVKGHMADNLKIGKVEVVQVFKTKVTPLPSVSDPAGENQTPREVIASKLLIIPDDPNDNWSLRGELTIPGALTFGAIYDLILVDHVEPPPVPENFRKFQEPEPELEKGELL
jgi:hypothetical protein